MTDLREGRIQAFIDNEMSDSEREAFLKDLAADPALEVAVRHQRQRSQAVFEVLDDASRLSDEVSVDVAAARAALDDRLAATGLQREPLPTDSNGRADSAPTGTEEPHASRQHRRPWRTLPFGKAAGFILLGAAAAAAAIPDSPVRRWVGGLVSSVPASSVAIESEAAPAVPSQVGLRVPVGTEGLVVRIAEPTDGSSLRVRLGSASVAEFLADAGTEFSTGAGAVQVSGVAGELVITIPVVESPITVHVGDSVLFTAEGGRLDVSGGDTAGSEFVFGLRQR